jgi:hopanoid biosynthesis associated radical SAM protein HpnH
MRFPLSMTAGMASYIARNKFRPNPEWQKTVLEAPDASNPFRIVYTHTDAPRKPHPMINKRFPLVLMLEPLHTCNLTCTGCGRIREYESTITQKLSLQQCMDAVHECRAPIISICGGEPMLYPELGSLVSKLIEENKTIYLCTNGMFIQKRLKEFKPADKFFFNVHLDGMEKNHDIAVERAGVFREAIQGVKAAKQAGFRVCTNTTVYKETDMNEIEELFEYLAQFKVDGHTISPAYGYSSVNDREIFMTRDDIHEKFKNIDQLAEKFPLFSTPTYLEFLQGKRDYPCTAWGNPTYNVKGWKGPCYLITDGHYQTFEELMTKTQWENYGAGNDPRCDHCMVHCGFEPSAALGINSKLGDTFKLMTWAFR